MTIPGRVAMRLCCELLAALDFVHNLELVQCDVGHLLVVEERCCVHHHRRVCEYNDLAADHIALLLKHLERRRHPYSPMPVHSAHDEGCIVHTMRGA